MTEVERRVSRRRECIAVGIVTTLALMLRLVGIDWGLPNNEHYFSYHPDEIFVLLPTFRFAQGIWNPGFFNYGPLYPYLVGLPALALGLVPTAPFPQGLAPVYLTGRIVTALLGTGTVPLLYLALRRESRSLAQNSALWLAICPLHVVNSHYAAVDVPATFFLVLAFFFALRGADKPSLRLAALTGLAVGFAAATKYNAGLFLAPALLAPVVARRSKAGIAWWLGVPAAAAIGFLICNPWVGTPEFRKGFLFEWQHAQAGGTLAFVGTGSGWSYHLLHGLPVALGYGLLAAAAIGLVAAFWSRSPAVRMSLLWLIFYFVVIGFGKERFIRYLVPMMPFVCLLAELPHEWASELAMAWKARGRWGFDLFSIPAGLPFALTAFYLFRIAASAGIDVRDESWGDNRWRAEKAKVGLVSAPWYFDPPVSPYNAGAFSLPQFNAWNAANGDHVVITGWDEAELRRQPPGVFILSDLESTDPVRLKEPAATSFVRALDGVYENRLVYPSEESPALLSTWLAPPRSWSPPDWLYPQPIITVYYGPRS